MPKYVLHPDGTIKDLDEINNGSFDVKGPRQYAREHINKMAGDPHYSEGDEEFGKLSNINLNVDLPFFDSGINKDGDSIGLVSGNHVTNKSVATFSLDSEGNKTDLFPKSGSAHNTSFGADDPVESRRNFNDYLQKGQIFATELEMVSGVDFGSPGIRDLTKFSIAIELFIESITYIGVIEGILETESLFYSYKAKNELDKDVEKGRRNDSHSIESKLELGNCGPTSLSSLTRYINDVLNYPYYREGVDGGRDIIARTSAYFIGFSEFINPDRQLYVTETWSKGFLSSNKTLLSGAFDFSGIIYYFMETVLSLTNLESNRLMMLVRKFNTQGDWHNNKLYKAKNLDLTKENEFEKYLVNLNYYYVKFIIERMNVGLKIRRYYKNKGNSSRKFKRSGRLKDTEHTLKKLKYNNNNILKIEDYNLDENKKHSIEMKQSMSISALPQAFILPGSLGRSAFVSNLTLNFVEEHVESYFLSTKKKQERLSQDVIKTLEEHYEQEMMPFYFQDLRTNELIGFHAFIESITDNYNPNYTTTKGFGRIDDVRHYVDTTRNVNLTFVLAAMSKEDHDLMWYQINKIVSMVYPQWSRGFKVTELNSEENSDKDREGFEYPFTQVPTASPLIRIRLGDVLKSNYTKHAIEKIHGSGNKLSKRYETVKDEYFSPKNSQVFNVRGFRFDDVSNNRQFKIINKVKLDDARIKVLDDGFKALYPDEGYDFSNKFEVKVTIVSGDSTAIYIAEKDEIIVNSYSRPIDYDVKKHFKDYTRSFDDEKNLNNPLTAAFESTLGKGLAGFITMLDVNYQDQLWEIDPGSQAPKVVKISINFAPLHDIPPGLDADGAMRAPVYNAGKIIRSMYGDVYDNKS